MISAFGVEHGDISKGLKPHHMRALMNTSRGRQVFGPARPGGGYLSSDKKIAGSPRAREYAQAKMDLRLQDLPAAEAKKKMARLVRTRRQDRGKLP